MSEPVMKAVLADPIVKAVIAEKVTGGPTSADATVTTEKGTTTTTTAPHSIVLASGQVVAAPTTTEEEDRGTAGQRTVNLLWENTQAKLAIAVVYTVLIVAGALSFTALLPWASERQMALSVTAFMLLSSLATLVIGFYYGRTNHQKVGGVTQGR